MAWNNPKQLTGMALSAALATLLTTACVAESATTDATTRVSAELTDAEQNGDALVEVEIIRDNVELRDALRPHPDLDVINTALVFNNPRGVDTVVYCVARNGNGRAIGRARVKVPGQGVRFMFASDIANGLDFIGSAECRSRSPVIPTAFVLGAGFSDTDARIQQAWDETRIRFPIVASY